MCIFKGTYSIISNQWVAMSLWEPIVDWVQSLQSLCRVCFIVLVAVLCSCGHHDRHEYLYPLWLMSHLQSWLLWVPLCFPVDLKISHQCTTKKPIMRWYQQGIHWPFSWCVFFLLFFTALSHSECLPERVTSHGSIFSRGELCCSMCPWWVELMLRALEKYSSW